MPYWCYTGVILVILVLQCDPGQATQLLYELLYSERCHGLPILVLYWCHTGVILVILVLYWCHTGVTGVAVRPGPGDAAAV